MRISVLTISGGRSILGWVPPLEGCQGDESESLFVPFDFHHGAGGASDMQNAVDMFKATRDITDAA